MQLIVEGWRFIPHSYAIVNQFQLLALQAYPQVELFHQDAPFAVADWQPVRGLLSPEQEAAIAAIPPPQPGQVADATLRLYGPFNFTAAPSHQTLVFAVTEWGKLTAVMQRAMNLPSLKDLVLDPRVTIVTPSTWSKMGLVFSGIDPDRIVIIPHGFDPALYHPIDEAERQALRRRFGWQDDFVFLNVSVMSNRKGIGLLLKAFAQIIQRYPQAKLVLKGREAIFGSRQSIASSSRAMLSPAEADRVRPQCQYLGDTLSFAEVAKLYQAADAYVAPYVAEGFNLPVLEATACGLPVICTQGGPTDDFTQPDFALGIKSQRRAIQLEGEERYGLFADLDHLISLLQTAIEHSTFMAQARRLGPAFVRTRFTWQHVVEQLLQLMPPR
ncbi:glycosyltransferase [Trichothermofontia sp.]